MSEERQEAPYLAAALLCERALEERDGVLSIIRVVDQVILQPIPLPGLAPGPPPEGIPLLPVQITMVVIMKTGDTPGTHEFRFQIENPLGERGDLGDSVPMVFQEGAGVTLNLGLVLQLQHPGFHWIDVMLDGRRITRVPLSVVYSAQAPQPDPSMPGNQS